MVFLALTGLAGGVLMWLSSQRPQVAVEVSPTPATADALPIYATLRSAIKWLLLDNKLQKALHIISRFKEDSWFWVGEPNFFVI